MVSEFDAGLFLELLSTNEELKEKLDHVKGLGRKVLFVVPGNGGGAWMEDGTSLTMSFDNICFLQLNSIMKGEVSCANSLAGTLCTYDESKVKLFRKDSIANPEDAELIPELLTDDATELEVISSFSVDIGGMDARVIVTDCNSLSQLTREPTTVVKSASSLDSFMVSPPGVSPWRDSLLEKLRQPAAAPLVKEIKRLLKYLELETVSTENRSKTVQRFYEDSRAMLQSSPAWNMLERDELDGSMDVIEKYIFAKCFSVVYQPADSDDAVQDKLFIEKINSLSDVVKFSSLCVALENIVEDDPSLDRYVDCSIAMEKAGQVECPHEKLDHLMTFVKNVALSNQETSSDLLIPIMVWIVLKRPPNTLISDVRYIQRYRDHSRLSGEAAFCLTNIIAVITTIEKLYAEHFNQTAPIYSMLASHENLNRASSSNEVISTTPTSKPLLDLTNTVMNTIGFVPRAIGSAVADTFRSRSNRASAAASTGVSGCPSSTGVSPSTVTPQRSTSIASSPTIMYVDPEIRLLREKVMKNNDVHLLSLKELLLAMEDYRHLLNHFNG